MCVAMFLVCFQKYILSFQESSITRLQKENRVRLTQNQNVNEELSIGKEIKELTTQKQNDELSTESVRKKRLLIPNIEKESEEFLTPQQYPEVSYGYTN